MNATSFETISAANLGAVIGGEGLPRTDAREQYLHGVADGVVHNAVHPDRPVWPVFSGLSRELEFESGVKNGGLIGVIRR